MVFDRLVADASPLIFLSRVGGIDWIARLSAQPVTVPQSVADEVSMGAEGFGIVDALSRHERFEMVPDLPLSLSVAAWDLGRGESQVLLRCAAHPGPVALLDDLAARKCAASLGIRTVGTLGIVVVARQKRWIPAARPIMEALIAHGMFLSPQVLASALERLGE